MGLFGALGARVRGCGGGLQIIVIFSQEEVSNSDSASLNQEDCEVLNEFHPVPRESGNMTYLEDDLQHAGACSGTGLRAGCELLTLLRLQMVILAVVRARRS